MRKSHFIGIALVILLGFGLLGYFFFFSATPYIKEAGDAASSAPAPVLPAEQSGLGKTSGRDVPAGQVEYYNPYYYFSLLYPAALKVGERNENGGAITVTFEDIEPKTVSGFQLFIVPFAGNQITEARFKQDIPSGVRKSIKNIKIAGATGASFYSTDKILGDTAEVWFISQGYLYEATSFKELAPALNDILQTWTFL
jgi:hypothetical protein